MTAGVLTGVLLFLLAIPASIIGWRANLDYLDLWHTRIITNERVGPTSNFNIHSYRNQSLANAVYLWDKATAQGLGPDSQAKPTSDRPERIVHSTVPAVVGLILVVLFVVGWSLGRQKDLLDQATAYGLACCATIGLTIIMGPLLHGRGPGRSLRGHLASASRQACASQSRRRDPRCPFLVPLSGDALHRRAWPSGVGHHRLVPGRLRLDPRYRGRRLIRALDHTSADKGVNLNAAEPR